MRDISEVKVNDRTMVTYTVDRDGEEWHGIASDLDMVKRMERKDHEKE